MNPSSASFGVSPLGEDECAFANLLAAARRGDAGAREGLFRRIYPRLQRIAHASMANEVRLRRPWLAALFSTGDIVQDVCERVLADLHTFTADTERALVAWLGVAVRNRLFDVLRYHEAARRDCRRAIASGDAFDTRAAAPGPATQALRDDFVASFWGIAAKLPPREQELLQHRMHGGCTFEELAHALDFPSADAARKAFHAAQARLLVLLRRTGFAPEAEA